MFSKKSEELGKQLLAKGAVGSPIFSEGTYQVEVQSETKKSFWPFLQISDKGEIQDAFCTCESEGCAHIPAAYFKIMKGSVPLHVRFRESLWHQIGLLLAERVGYEPKSFTKAEEKGFFSLKYSKKSVEKKFHELLFNRPLETEETSIKFSNLSAEEIALWREGRPSLHLKFELSFWADLAKEWLLSAEYDTAYEMDFSPIETLPTELKVTFPGYAFTFSIDAADWPLLVPTLNAVKSPLKFFPLGGVLKVAFNDVKKRLELSFRQKKEGAKVPINGFEFVSGEGFYQTVFKKTEIEAEEIGAFLSEFGETIAPVFSEKLFFKPHKIHYSLFFDHKDALHIRCYLFKPGDLTGELFGDWGHIEGKGFYKVEGKVFDQCHVIIHKEEVGKFVSQKKVWLHDIEGFSTHVTSVEAPLIYQFDEEGNLSFHPRSLFDDEGEAIRDFGNWVYLKGKGFYAKQATTPGSKLHPDLQIPPSEISSFIENFSEDLETVPGFFAVETPLIQAGVNIGFNEEKRITIHPEYAYRKGVEPQSVRFYGKYTFVQGEGFCQLPPQFRLPTRYLEPKVIDVVSEPYFVGYELGLLMPHVLKIDPRLEKPKTLSLQLEKIRRDAKAKTGQWVMQLTYKSHLGTVSPYQIWEAMENKCAYLFSDAGLIFLRNMRFEWLKGRGKKRWLKGGEALRMTTLELLQLLALEKIEPPTEKRSAALWQQFIHFEPPVGIDTHLLKSQLRTYQKMGVSWLWFLYSYGLSGLLCDEMGLGKTHQAMGLMAGIKHLQPKAKFLVICPTSVIYHWEDLIHRFLPDVKPYVFHGLGRDFSYFAHDSHDLLLTSYGVARSEQKALSSFPFDLVVFDEIQVAKNEKSLTHKALRNFQAGMRLGLTGTPIENRLLELKALFDLTVPGYLPRDSVFKELFIHPIEKQGDTDRKELLKKTIAPFLLRRKKREVLTELPEKIEEVLYCDLSSEQQRLYSAVYNEHKEQLLASLQDSAQPLPLAHIFSLLSKLKQICDHPSLFLDTADNYKEHESGKWSTFVELLAETRDSGQKLVVFTQYLTMMDIMGAYLQEQGIGYSEIRGSTRKRKEAVQTFQKDPSCEVFLGSLQAAGVGIDLTAASVVIHYDRWWNPAKENQATDRVHRMGQNRGVQVFKLVTKDTVEEEVHRIIERKLQLSETVGFDSHDQIKGLQREELINLIKAIGKKP